MATRFNAGHYLVDRHVAQGRGDRVAVRAPSRTLTYAELEHEVRRVAAGLAAMGVVPEQRVLLCLVDEVELFTAILAAFRLGAVAVPVSTMLRGSELAGLVVDCRARVLLCSGEFAPVSRDAVARATGGGGGADLAEVVVTGDDVAGYPAAVRVRTWRALLSGGAGHAGGPYPTWDESPALWLYTSGTTGSPKAAMHRHADIRHVAETYAREVLVVGPDDVCFSVAKLFFAYGLGNSMFFPLSVGASVVLEPTRPVPAGVAGLVAAHAVTLFFGTPSVFGPLLAADVDDDALASVRLGVSAGETLPPRMVHGMRERFGVEVLDGIGSTEALHIYLSNRPGRVVAGSSGTPVPGYEVQIRDDAGVPVTDGRPGTLYVRGDSICTGYWCRTEVNRRVFEGEWLRTGDTYVRNPDGTYTCLGRTDDVLKVGGIWVTPAEVEERLAAHPSVVDVAVVGVPDEDGLDQPVACVVPRDGVGVDAGELVDWCREGLASFKRPRRVLVVDELPRTATGKVQRFLVRERAAASLRTPIPRAGEQEPRAAVDSEPRAGVERAPSTAAAAPPV